MAICQYRYGDPEPVNLRFTTGTTVADGCALGTTNNDVTRPADVTWNTDLATTQADFAAKFVGVADQEQPSTTLARIPGNSADNLIRVLTDGVFDIPLATATAFKVGEFAGPAKDTGNALLNTSFAKVTPAASACFVCVEDTNGVSVTTIRCRPMSYLTRKGT